MYKTVLSFSILFVYSITYAGNAGDIESPDSVLTDTAQVEELLDTAEVGIPEDIVEEASDTILDEEILLEEETSGPLLKDVFLVLDNSGSMKKNDPDFLVSQAVKEFISQQDSNTRVGIVIFDQSVRLPVALTEASFANRLTILDSLKEINYKGLFTDSPAGIERAIYELKNTGRENAEKSIIFMTDGIVDTGETEKDIEKAKWLREDLAPDAADNDIKIFGIAFTEAADFQLIQSIAQKTDGEYFRALQAMDLTDVFTRIDQIINEPPEPETPTTTIVQQVIASEPEEPIVQAPPPPPQPVIIEVPTQAMGEEERIRSIIMIAAAIILTITLLAILFLLIRRNKELKDSETGSAQEAYINDISGKTEQQTHQLGVKPTMFGRVAGQDTEHLNYIVVNESTIGRRHALIEYKDYSFWIIDQGSINGTFVNGEPVKTEVRLKHGDKVRLHKCDFEFVMPEMEDSGMTQISNTVFAAQGGDDSEEATVMRGDESENELSQAEKDQVGDSEMDFDLTGSPGPADDDLSDLYEPEDEAETLIHGNGESNSASSSDPEFILDEEGKNSDEETIIIDDDDDATLMPGDEDDDFDDADSTLRKDET